MGTDFIEILYIRLLQNTFASYNKRFHPLPVVLFTTHCYNLDIIAFPTELRMQETAFYFMFHIAR